MLFRDEDEDLEVLPFADRADGGRILAGKLSAYADRGDAVVLGLPRGGVTVASAVAGALRLPLDVFVVSKIGIPWEKEFAMGALAEGGMRVLDLSVVKSLVSRSRVSKRQQRLHERNSKSGKAYIVAAVHRWNWKGRSSLSWMMASRRDAACWRRLRLSAGKARGKL